MYASRCVEKTHQVARVSLQRLEGLLGVLRVDGLAAARGLDGLVYVAESHVVVLKDVRHLLRVEAGGEQVVHGEERVLHLGLQRLRVRQQLVHRRGDGGAVGRGALRGEARQLALEGALDVLDFGCLCDDPLQGIA